VAVIASAADLRTALAIRHLPDLFELRLDSLSPISAVAEKKISRLRAPIIITARDPREGGIGKLSLEDRRALLLRFLPYAKYIDIELQAAREFKSLLSQAKKRKVRLILSYHNFKATPSSRSLCAKAKRAKAFGADIFKVATRTDAPAALGQLVDFLTSSDSARAGRAGARRRRTSRIPLAVMGIGKLGAISRVLLARCGSVLNYASLGQPNVEGQHSFWMLRAALTGSNAK
jgi:3-dehydroquinate dehydratase-1